MDIKRINHLVVKLLLLAAAVFLLWQLQFVFIILLVAFLLTVILLPFVRVLHKARIPAVFAVFLPLVALGGLLTLLGVYVAPTVREQALQLADQLPRYTEQIPFVQELDIDTLGSWLSRQLDDLNIGQLALDVGAAFFKALLALITILFITIYWLSDYTKIKRTLVSYVPNNYQTRAKDIWTRMENKLGKWFLGQIMISTIVGVIVWIAATIIGLPFAAVLGVLAAILEIVPTVGPIVAAIPAILLGAAISIETALLVTVVYIVIQQIESHFITPLLMGRRVRLHPIMIITAFLIGTVTFGILGALLSVPVAIAVSAVVDSFRNDEPLTPALHGKKAKNTS